MIPVAFLAGPCNAINLYIDLIYTQFAQILVSDKGRPEAYGFFFPFLIYFIIIIIIE